MNCPTCGQPLPPPAPGRTLRFGYFATFPLQIGQTRDQINLLFETLEGPFDEAMDRIRLFSGYTVLSLIHRLSPAQTMQWREEQVRWLFDQLRLNNLLQFVCVLYCWDEPDNPNAYPPSGLTDKFVRENCAMVRRVAGGYPELEGVKLATIYTTQFCWPGVSAFDIVGGDKYDEPAQAMYDRIKPQLRDDQKMWLVPGGINPYRQDPEPFYQAALAHPEIVGIIPFRWVGTADQLGIRDNGMAPSYRAVGMAIKNE